MDNLLVAVFENENKASMGALALRELHTEATVLVYALAVITKGWDKITVMEVSAGQALLEPVIGRATQSLIKLLEEPLSHIDNGGSGPIVDWMINMANAGVDGDFVDEVARHLLPGRSAIVSEIEEEMPTSLDILLESLGGVIFRCVRRDIMDAQIATDLDGLHREMKTLENALLSAQDDAKPILRMKLDLAKTRFQTTKERARCLAASIKREAEAKIVSLQERAAKADGGIREKFERLANEVRVDYVNRATKLNLAGKLRVTSSQGSFF